MTGWKKTVIALLISITALSIPSALLLGSPGPGSRCEPSQPSDPHPLRTPPRSRALEPRPCRLRGGSRGRPVPRRPTRRRWRPQSPAKNFRPRSALAFDLAFIAPVPVPTRAQLRRDVRRVRFLQRLLATLRHESVLQQAAAHGNWMPIVRDAAPATTASARSACGGSCRSSRAAA